MDRIVLLDVQDAVPAAQPSVSHATLKCMLDLVPYGMVLVAPDGTVQFANRYARREFDAQSPICLQGRLVYARRPQDVESLRQALLRASSKGRQGLMRIGSGGLRQTVVAITPVGEAQADGSRSAMLIFGKREVCEELSADAFGREFGLTWAEVRVLKQLIAGLSPVQAAASQGVAISTMRTQIASIRDKTSAADIVDLLRTVSLLPSTGQRRRPSDRLRVPSRPWQLRGLALQDASPDGP